MFCHLVVVVGSGNGGLSVFFMLLLLFFVIAHISVHTHNSVDSIMQYSRLHTVHQNKKKHTKVPGLSQPPNCQLFAGAISL